MIRKAYISTSVACLISLLVACAPAPPNKPLDICAVFRQYPSWYRAAHATERHWGVPVSVQMAIMHAESHFHADAKPARGKILWVIPWARPSTAEGYAQAENGTWHLYLKETQRSRASRSSFAAASDFIGWYGARIHHKLGISRRDPYTLYLAYHEGIGGYRRRTYVHKPWLKKLAYRVSATAARYRHQLIGCEHSLPRHRWWHIF